MFLGEDLLAWLVFAFGGAMAVGNALALVRPPQNRRGSTEVMKPPVVRTVTFALIGAVAAVWALASLVGG